MRMRDLSRQHESAAHLADELGELLPDRPLPGLPSGRRADLREALDLDLPAARARRDPVAPLTRFPARDAAGILEGRRRIRSAHDTVAENLEQLDAREARRDALRARPHRQDAANKCGSCPNAI